MSTTIDTDHDAMQNVSVVVAEPLNLPQHTIVHNSCVLQTTLTRPYSLDACFQVEHDWKKRI